MEELDALFLDKIVEEKQGRAGVSLGMAVQQELRRCFKDECPDCEVKKAITLCNYGVRAMEVQAGQPCIHEQYKPAVPALVNERDGEACRS
jgi:hypothetical protein